MANIQNLKHFKKGYDPKRNKNGRPKKLPHLDILLAEVLGEKKNKKTAAEHILMALRNKATKGDARAAEILLDRGYGKVKQEMKIEGPIFEATVFVLPNGRQVKI